MNLDKFQGLDIVLLGGVYGSGKTVFAVKYFKEKGRLRISRSEIRKLLHEMTHYGERMSQGDFSESGDSLVKHVERKILEQFLHQKEKVLLINTFATKASRKRFVDMAEKSRKSIGMVFISRPLDGCIERNKRNANPVPEIVVRSMHGKIELPDKSEGFKEVTVVRYK